MSMTPEEVRVEAARRVKRAEDLKIRETLWKIKRDFDHVRGYAKDNSTLDRDFVKQDPAFGSKLTYPGVKFLDDSVQFSLGDENCEIRYMEGRESHDSYGRTDFKTTKCVLTLRINNQPVFEFQVTETVEYAPDMPIFDQTMGKIVQFIEGPWVAEIKDFAKKNEEHIKRVWKERNAPREAKEAEDLKKRFGI